MGNNGNEVKKSYSSRVKNPGFGPYHKCMVNGKYNEGLGVQDPSVPAKMARGL